MKGIESNMDECYEGRASYKKETSNLAERKNSGKEE